MVGSGAFCPVNWTSEVSVRLSENGRTVTAKGADPDTLVASARAYLAALNKLVARQLRGEREERRIHSTDVG
jgi:2-isopropylmalate synthase